MQHEPLGIGQLTMLVTVLVLMTLMPYGPNARGAISQDEDFPALLLINAWSEAKSAASCFNHKMSNTSHASVGLEDVTMQHAA